MNDTAERFGARLRERRRALKLTQKALAERLLTENDFNIHSAVAAHRK